MKIEEAKQLVIAAHNALDDGCHDELTEALRVLLAELDRLRQEVLDIENEVENWKVLHPIVVLDRIKAILAAAKNGNRWSLTKEGDV
jgi:hypothetical protein